MNLKSAHTGKIGKMFKKARILRSMNENEVAAETLINIEYIKAIESGDFSVFPARMFALQYYYIIQYEESLLEKSYGEEYNHYRMHVPSLCHAVQIFSATHCN